jgi:hypothetical protein
MLSSVPHRCLHGYSATGGATMKAPKNGFADRDLTNYFQGIYKPATRSPTRAIPTPTSTPTTTPKGNSKKTKVGLIAGVAAGGFVILVLIAAILIYCCTKSKTKASHINGPQQQGLQPVYGIQHNPGYDVVEVNGENYQRHVAELPAAQSPASPKAELHYSITSVSSSPPLNSHSPLYSSTHSPPLQSPLPTARSLSYSQEGSSPMISPSIYHPE